MPRKPAHSAYILALALRQTCDEKQAEYQMAKDSNRIIREANVKLIAHGLEPYNEVEEDDTIMWSDVIEKLYAMQEIAENLHNISDKDYRSILWDAIKQPIHKTRGSKGFEYLVPVFETIRRYGAYDERRPMGISEEEARELANLIWQQEMEPFIESRRGVDPINKQIIANKVAAELKQVNVVYIGEQIINVNFNDTELDVYSVEHEDELAILLKGIECAAELFGFSPDNTSEKNLRNVRNAVLMYDSMLGKERAAEELEQLVTEIVVFIQYLYHLVE